MTVQAHEQVTFCGYYPGVIGKIVELHAVYYHENWGFDLTFETQVGSELSTFMKEFDPHRDGFWVALIDGRFAGAVAIDAARASHKGARLRWFIVEPRFQGRGVGHALLKKAVEFCRDRGYSPVFLWTFKGLEAARHLYERFGFRLHEEHLVEQWGGPLLEQRFELIPASITDPTHHEK